MWKDYILLNFTCHKCGLLFMITLFNFSSQVSIIQNSCMSFSIREWLRLFLEKYLGILLAIKSLSLCSWSHINLWLRILHHVSYHWKVYMTHKEHTIVTQGIFIPHIFASTWDAMEWERKRMQQALIFKIDFDKS